MKTFLRYSNGYILCLLVAICVLSRLPQLMNAYTRLDADECVLGLMAHHMAWGKDFPFYFWGQNYGFSALEALVVALGAPFLGASVLALKIPLLFLWTLGCLFFYQALAYWTTRIYAFAMSCILILSPAWMAWSIKARGGYVTAFLLNGIVLFLLAKNWPSLKTKLSWVLGVLLGFIYISQPVFLFGVLPLSVFALSKNQALKNFSLCIAGFLFVFIIAQLMVHYQNNTGFWNPHWFRPEHFKDVVASYPARILGVLNQEEVVSSVMGKIASQIMLYGSGALLGLSAVMYGLTIIFRKKNLLAHLLGGTIFLYVLALIWIARDQYRYLLSFSEFLILFFAVLGFQERLGHIVFKWILYAIMSVLIIAGCVLFYEEGACSHALRADETSQTQRISHMIAFLKTAGVAHVFTVDNDLGWELLYFSHERIMVRFANIAARQPLYSQAVDAAYLNGKPLALVGDWRQEPLAYALAARQDMTEILDNQYFVQLYPNRDFLAHQMRFELPVS